MTSRSGSMHSGRAPVPRRVRLLLVRTPVLWCPAFCRASVSMSTVIAHDGAAEIVLHAASQFLCASACVAVSATIVCSFRSAVLPARMRAWLLPSFREFMSIKKDRNVHARTSLPPDRLERLGHFEPSLRTWCRRLAVASLSSARYAALELRARATGPAAPRQSPCTRTA